jgi:hypothetical protein
MQRHCQPCISPWSPTVSLGRHPCRRKRRCLHTWRAHLPFSTADPWSLRVPQGHRHQKERRSRHQNQNLATTLFLRSLSGTSNRSLSSNRQQQTAGATSTRRKAPWSPTISSTHRLAQTTSTLAQLASNRHRFHPWPKASTSSRKEIARNLSTNRPWPPCSHCLRTTCVRFMTPWSPKPCTRLPARALGFQCDSFMTPWSPKPCTASTTPPRLQTTSFSRASVLQSSPFQGLAKPPGLQQRPCCKRLSHQRPTTAPRCSSPGLHPFGRVQPLPQAPPSPRRSPPIIQPSQSLTSAHRPSAFHNTSSAQVGRSGMLPESSPFFVKERGLGSGQEKGPWAPN